MGKEASEHLLSLCHRALSGESVYEGHIRIINGESLKFYDKVYPDWDGYGHISGVRGIMFCIGPEEIPAQTEYRQDREPTGALMRSMYQKIHWAAQSNGIVLLTGESGSGKDYFARRIHELSKRANEPFEILNCAALPETLAESELFGHEAGAFTGTKGRKRGLLEMAGAGTVVLDELGDMPLNLQTKLLTFLDTRCFKRLGGEKNIHCKARIIVTTNSDLKNAVAEGRFRKDLYYRINVFAIRVPPLRERPEEILFVVRNLLTNLTISLELGRIPQIDGFAMKKLLSYDWPGNVRELRNVLERAITHANGPQIGAEHIVFDTEEEPSSGHQGFEDGQTSTYPQAVDIPKDIANKDFSRTEIADLLVPMKNPPEEQIRALHEEFVVRKGCKSPDIGRACGTSDSTVRKWFNKYGLSTGNAGRPRKKRAE